MRGKDGIGLRVLAKTVCLLLCGAHASADGDDWNQRRGNAAGTAASTVEPIRAEPVEEWRVELGQIFGEPVSWGGVVYVLGVKGRNRRLFAFRAAGGERLGSIGLGKDDPTGLAVWQGTVVVSDEKGLRTFAHKRDRFQLRKRLAGNWTDLCVADNLLFANGASLSCIEIDRGKELFSVSAGKGRPAVRSDGTGNLSVATYGIGTSSQYVGLYLKLYVLGVSGGGSAPERGRLDHFLLGRVHDRLYAGPGYVSVFETDVPHQPSWFIRSSRPLESAGGDEFNSCTVRIGEEGIRLAEVVTDAAIYDNHAFGFSPARSLIRVRSDGAFQEVVAVDELPAGARPGVATAAGDVLYLGNWAIEIESRRVLWCRESIAPVGSLVPVADGRAVYVTHDGDLVGLVDPRQLEAELVPVSLAAGGQPQRPDAGKVVILDDGQVLVAPATGTFDEARVVFVESPDGAELVGEQYPVFLAWRNVIYADFHGELAKLVESYARDRHLGECQRLLEEAEEFGMPPEDLRQLRNLLAGKAENRSANVEAKLGKKRGREDEVRRETVSRVLEATAWCRARGLEHAATVLLARGRKVVLGANLPEIVDAARELIPDGFPWRDESDAPLRWMAWADEMLPAGAAFVPRTDAAWQDVGSPWDERAIALRTENLLLFSLETDPEVIGPALRKGEGTIRALTELLPPAEAATEDPLEVRIHADREGYLEDMKASGVELAWSAGFYSPAERISRFFVPRNATAELLDRQLHYVLSHEITHHYIDQRWLPGAGRAGPSDPPGYWVVEGFARFIEDQVLELGRIDRGFTDPTVKSLDTASQVALIDGLLPLSKLIDSNYAQFIALPDTRDFEVQRRYTLSRVGLSSRGVFYDQSGSLVFYLMNRRGEAGRQALIDYLRAYYRGKTKTSGWKALGFEDVDELESGFVDFLAQISG